MKKTIFGVLMLGALVLAGCKDNAGTETPATTATELWPAFNSEVGLYGYINKKGEWAIPAQFKMADSYFSNGVAQVNLNGKNVFIDKSGKIKSSVSFDSAEEFYYGYAKAEINGKYGLLNSKLEYAIDPVYDASLSNMTSDGIVTFKADANHYGFLDKKGNILMKDKAPVYYEEANAFRDGYCVVCKDVRTWVDDAERIPTYCLIDTKFAEVISEGNYMYMKNLGFGLLSVRQFSKDKDAKVEYDIYSVKDKRNLTSIKYKQVNEFSADGYAVVATGDDELSYGVINTEGTSVVPISLDGINKIGDGYAWGSQKKDEFLIDLSNNSRVYTLVNKEGDEMENSMSGVHNGLVLIKKTTVDKNGDREVEYRWMDVKDGNKTVYSWKYDKDSKYQGDLNPKYAPAR